MTPLILDFLGLFWGERGLIRGINGMIRLEKVIQGLRGKIFAMEGLQREVSPVEHNL